MLKMRHSGSGQQRMILVMVNKNQISKELSDHGSEEKKNPASCRIVS